MYFLNECLCLLKIILAFEALSFSEGFLIKWKRIEFEKLKDNDEFSYGYLKLKSRYPYYLGYQLLDISITNRIYNRLKYDKFHSFFIKGYENLQYKKFIFDTSKRIPERHGYTNFLFLFCI